MHLIRILDHSKTEFMSILQMHSLFVKKFKQISPGNLPPTTLHRQANSRTAAGYRKRHPSECSSYFHDLCSITDSLLDLGFGYLWWQACWEGQSQPG
jgi:hypothetical protein